MTEIEQLRKEINELRERVAKLEARKDRLVQKEIDALREEKRQWCDAHPYPLPQWRLA